MGGVEKPTVLSLIQGGKSDEDPIIEPKLQGSGPTGPDWLRELHYGAKFTAYEKRNVNPVFYDQFGVAFIMEDQILLACDQPNNIGNATTLCWVNSENFSKVYKLVAVLPEYNPPEEEGNNNGNHLPRPADG